MSAFLSLSVDCDPVRMRVINVLMNRVRIGARDYDHVHFPASCHQLPEGIGFAHPRAAPVQWDLGGIVRHASSGAETGGVGVDAAEVIEPELGVVMAGVV